MTKYGMATPPKPHNMENIFPACAVVVSVLITCQVEWRQFPPMVAIGHDVYMWQR